MPAKDAVPISATRLTASRLMMPTDANPHGNVHGGAIVKYIDEHAGIIAHRHARANTVTVSIDRMHFVKPVYIGNVLILKGAVNYVGKTSMEIGVRAEAEDLNTGSVVHTGSCYLTYVALDRGGNPIQVPKVFPASGEEERWNRQAKERRERSLEDLRSHQGQKKAQAAAKRGAKREDR